MDINDANPILLKLRDNGHKAYLIGGCVRDHLLGLPINDIDVATSATPDEVHEIFECSKFVGQSFGVCIVPLDGKNYEVATFRKDGVYMDGRHPSSVTFGDMKDDALRRDFTMNAIFFDPISGKTIDFVGGYCNLKDGVVRAVGDPRYRFEEDPLRILRAIRFASRFGFEIHDSTAFWMKTLIPKVRFTVSFERQRDEITKMIVDKNASRAIRLMEELDILKYILPQIDNLKNITDQGKNHPEGDAFTHTMLVLDGIERRTPVLCWAALLHDIGKLATFSEDENGVHFYGHEEEGAKMADVILKYLRFSNEDQKSIIGIVESHMMPFSALEWQKKTMRRFLSDELCDDLLDLHKADILASSKVMVSYDHIINARKNFAEEKTPIMPVPLLNGNDLIAMGYQPGPEFRHILTTIQDKQLDGAIETRDDAMDFMLNHYKGYCTS